VGKRRLDFDDEAGGKRRKSAPACPPEDQTQTLPQLELGEPCVAPALARQDAVRARMTEKQASIKRWLAGARSVREKHADAESRARGAVVDFGRHKAELEYKLRGAADRIQRVMERMRGGAACGDQQAEAEGCAVDAMECFGRFMTAGMRASNALEVARMHEHYAEKEREAARESAVKNAECCEALRRVKSKVTQGVVRWLGDPVEVSLDRLEEYEELVMDKSDTGTVELIQSAHESVMKVKDMMEGNMLQSMEEGMLLRMAAEARDKLVEVYHRPLGQAMSTLEVDANEIYGELEEYVKMRGEIEMIARLLESL